jgi:biotin operon repressor
VSRSTTVSRKQRFHSTDNPCPACGGGQDLQGDERCYGYLFEDGGGFMCTNVESDQFNDEADAWVHFFEDERTTPISVNVKNGERGRSSGRLTLNQLARDKGLPAAAFRALGCRDNGRGVLIGGRLRLHDPKYVWTDNRSPSTDPTFPMPEETVEAHIFITAGETDTVTMRHAGRAAYGITSGEKKGKPSLTPAHYRDLMKRGATHVTIAGDGDAHGQAWMRNEAASAQAAGLKVSVVDLAPLYDHFGAGVKDLNELWLSVDRDLDAFLAAVDEHTREYTQIRVYSLDDLREVAETEITYIVNDLLSPGEKAGLTGPPKNYKTWLALNLACAVATGGRFLERSEWQCPDARPVVMVEEEGDLVKNARRVKRAFRDAKAAPFHLIPKMGFSLLVRAQVDWLIERVREREAGLLILDPWQRMIVGADEDKATDTGPAWDEVHRITVECPDCAVLILHHANKAGGLGLNASRGSSRFPGEVDLSMVIEVKEPGLIHAALYGRDVPNHMAEEGYLEVRFDVDDPFAMSALGFRANVRTAGRPSKERDVLSLFRDNPGVEFSKTEIAQRTGMSASTVGTHVNALTEQGILVKNARKFRLNEGAQA